MSFTKIWSLLIRDYQSKKKQGILVLFFCIYKHMEISAELKHKKYIFITDIILFLQSANRQFLKKKKQK